MMICEICGKDSDGGKVGGHCICFDCYSSEDPDVINALFKIMYQGLERGRG